MKKILFILLLCSSISHAVELYHAKTFKQAQEEAIKKNKNILLFLTSRGCYYCAQMKKRTLKEEEVIRKINSDFIFVELDEHRKQYPSDIKVSGVPAMIFLDTKAKQVIKPVLGYWGHKNFMGHINRANQHYQTKNKDKK